MNCKEAQAQVKEKAFGKYHFRAAQLLTRLVNATYSPTDAARDIEGVPIKKKIATIQGWLNGIGNRQLFNLFSQLEEVTVTKRVPGWITVVLNLEPLKTAEKATHKAKRTLAQRAADRASKARQTYAEKRKAARLTDAATAMREHKERFFDTVLKSGYSAETLHKHGSLIKAETPKADTVEDKSASPLKPLPVAPVPVVHTVRRGPIKVAGQ